MEETNIVFKTEKLGDREFVSIYEINKDTDDELRLIELVDPMTTEASGIAWGYKGSGPNTLTKIIMDRVWGKVSEYNNFNNKYYSKSYNNLLDYIGKMDENEAFEITKDTILDLFRRPDIETYKFREITQLLSDVMNFVNEQGLDNASKMHTILRIHMPYVINIDTEEVSLQNRDYAALGDLKNAFLYKNNNSTSIRIKTTMYKETIYSIVDKYGGVGCPLYFYNDACTPWSSKSNLIKYFVRLNSILSYFTNEDFLPMFLKGTKLPSSEIAWEAMK